MWTSLLAADVLAAAAPSPVDNAAIATTPFFHTLSAADGQITGLDASVTAASEGGASPETLNGMLETDANVLNTAHPAAASDAPATGGSPGPRMTAPDAAARSAPALVRGAGSAPGPRGRPIVQ